MADLLSFPTEVKNFFQKGAFVVSITGHDWHCVGVNEAHEMLINKVCKTSIMHPTKDYISRITHYLPYWARCIDNIKKELFVEDSTQNNEPTSLISRVPAHKKSEENIITQI